MRTRRVHELRPRRRPSQARARETVGAIIEAAARVFTAHGYAAGTTNRIAEAAGVSVGSLYEYFPNKDALLVSLMEAHVAEGEALLAAVATDVVRERPDLRATVRRFIEAMVALHARDRGLHRVLFEEAPLPPRLRRRLAAVEAGAARAVAAHLHGLPEVRVPDVALAARVVVETVEALTHKLVVHGSEGDLAAQTEEFVTLVVAYLTAERGAAARSQRTLRS